MTIAIEVHLDADAAATMARDVRAGLCADPKELAPKYFYDERGSQLFEQITELPEYYPTRAERQILERALGRDRRRGRRPRHPDRARLRLGREDPPPAERDARPRQPRHLRAGRHLRGDHPAHRRRAGRGVPRPRRPRPRLRLRAPPGADPDGDGTRLIAFLGGTIGNLYPRQRPAFLARIAALLGPGDHLLLGTDLVKDRARLEAAYDDAAGVTAEFNKNVLAVLNRELGADFDLDAFEHVARYDAEAERMDIRLRSLADQEVRLDDLDLDGRLRRRRGDADRDLDQVHPRAPRGVYAGAGLEMSGWFTDAAGDYALSLAGPPAPAPAG